MTDTRQAKDMTWDEIVALGTRMAIEAGMPPKVLLSQMAHETGFGTSGRAKRNQLFGVGVYNDDSPGFQYATAAESIQGYIDLLRTDPRYARAWASRNDPEKMIREIVNAGYAADPEYEAKIKANRYWRKDYSEEEKAMKSMVIPTPTPTLSVTPTPEQSKPWYQTLWNMFVPQARAAEYVAKTPYGMAPVSSQPSQTQYTVKAGDTLSQIAQDYLGSANRWKELGYQGNPNTMPIGTKLTIPQQQSQATPTPKVNPYTQSQAPYAVPQATPTPKVNPYAQSQAPYTSQTKASSYKAPTRITIPQGATLSGLAKQYNTTVAELLKKNPNITNPNLIYAGAGLTI